MASLAQQPDGAESDRYKAVRALYGDATFRKIQDSRLLVVGAGGIGCELLKNLVLTGFRNVDIIDLDTIDVSNLNRQFLFRREHVGQSKATVAREAVLRFNSAVSVTAHHANIKAASFPSSFFSSFSLVLNALDNIDARRHVNRLCLAASVPLVESGTQATSGQVVPIVPHVTECYECNPIATPKTYAVCTIRSTPDRDVHCVAWAKYVFDALFGPEDEGNVMNDLRATMTLPGAEENGSDEAAERYFRQVVQMLFESNIDKQLESTESWLSRRPPSPIRVDTVLASSSSSSPAPASLSSPRSLDQTVLSTRDTVLFLLSSLRRLLSPASGHVVGVVGFDKDNDAAMDVVSCLANLRMINFHIPPLSRFRVKGIAGNIVHAIATTNAVAAGLIVLEAIKMLAAAPDPSPASTQVYISPYRPYLLQPQRLDPPRPTCYLCSDSTLTLRCDTAKLTLCSFFSSVLCGALDRKSVV